MKTPIYNAKRQNELTTFICTGKETMRITKKGKVISVTGREGPEGCETSRLQHFL
jgi:hypothetical protein